MDHGGAAAAAAIQAIKASGAIVRIEPDEFRRLLSREPESLVVHARAGLFNQRHRYLMGHRGLVFYACAAEPITLPARCQVIEARRIWAP